ncbi:MAG TPA: ASKHA domain-containing protein, partial [Candidatus Wunengus sp. YC61]|uniref:ASKHA domain-containing protein n=1 Tax=Candidatus Wunengus sp. YC61 TaxID=3367698 RepID=UPI004029916C
IQGNNESSPPLVGGVRGGSELSQLSFDVIGGGKPRGICGSGLVEAVSELVRVGLVNSRGRLQSIGSDIAVKYGTYLFEKNGRRCFRLAENVSISQEDIRQVQLAKAAIRSGIEILLTSHNLKPDDLKTAIIAGAFGYHLSKESLFGIGILPDLTQAKFSFVGNSSLEGAVQALLNKKLVDDTSRIARTVQVMELSQVSAFEDIFVKEMHF